MTLNLSILPYIACCPLSCAAPLEPTKLMLPEGPLRRCTECGQLVSAATEARYRETMLAFNAPTFNALSPPELERRHAVARQRLNTLSNLLNLAPANTRLLDIGCSRGQFVECAMQSGFLAEGVEPAPDIAAAAREAGLKVHTGLLEQQGYDSATYDAASLFEVVEHLREPLQLLQECRRILKPHGVLLISTGNTASWTTAAMGARWDYFHMAKDGGHISFFNPRSLRKLAHRAGFRVERLETSRVKFHERSEISKLSYLLGKVAAELLNVPARIMGRGHDMLAYLRRL